jgi:hypothetical protein
MSSRHCNVPCCIITGHHRSGTSLVASVLQSAGLEIGQNLLGPGDGNARGHFEDLHFLQFHMQVLASQGLDISGYIRQPRVEVQEQCRETALALVRARLQAQRAWGWKEPRTTLFLDFWKELLPDACFILLFRCPWEVIDSQFRRGDPAFQANPNLAAQVWLNYNRAILDFRARHPESCLLVQCHAAARQPALLLDTIAEKFGIQLGPPASLYEEALLSRETTSRHRALLWHFFPEAIDLYRELQDKADVKEKTEAPMDGSALAAAAADWALQDWVDLRHLQKRSRTDEADLAKTREGLDLARAEAEQFRAELTRSRSELEGMRGELTQGRTELEGMRGRLAQSRAELEGARAELTCVRVELERMHGERRQVEAEVVKARQGRQLAKAEAAKAFADLEAERAKCLQTEHDSAAQLCTSERKLDDLRHELAAARTRLAWMEGSRFWKLRRIWCYLRHPFLQRRLNSP